MHVMRACVISLCISTAILTGCESPPGRPSLADSDHPPEEQGQRPEPADPTTTAPASVPADTASPARSDGLIDPKPIPDTTQMGTGPIEVPPELYQRSFEEVQAVIANLNQIMDRRDYEMWAKHLTDRYTRYFRHPDVLADLSRQPFLAHTNTKLESIRDYFEKVVAPSRARARLDGLVFYSDSLVEAVTEYRGQLVILYLLRKIDGEWKIDTRETLPPEA